MEPSQWEAAFAPSARAQREHDIGMLPAVTNKAQILTLARRGLKGGAGIRPGDRPSEAGTKER